MENLRRLFCRKSFIFPIRNKKAPLFAVFFLIEAFFSTQSQALLIYDMDTSRQPILCSGSKSSIPTFKYALRIVTFDTDQQKVLQVFYLPYTASTKPLCATHRHFKVQYGPVHKETLSLTITPQTQDAFWIRTYGRLKAPSKSIKRLSQWDRRKTHKNWRLYIGKTQGPTPLTLSKILTKINQLNAQEQVKKQRASPATPHWKKKHSDAMQYWCVHPSKTLSDKAFSGSIFQLRTDLGPLGELASDLLMLSLGLIKHEGKYGSSQGFDGIYSFPDQDIWIVSEAKWWKSCPTLDRIESEYLLSKLDETNHRAITKIDPSLKKLLLNALRSQHLYVLPLGIFPDGQIYARLRLKSSFLLHLSPDLSPGKTSPAKKTHKLPRLSTYRESLTKKGFI